jgi:hypothetical protein
MAGTRWDSRPDRPHMGLNFHPHPAGPKFHRWPTQPLTFPIAKWYSPFGHLKNLT